MNFNVNNFFKVISFASSVKYQKRDNFSRISWIFNIIIFLRHILIWIIIHVTVAEIFMIIIIVIIGIDIKVFIRIITALSIVGTAKNFQKKYKIILSLFWQYIWFEHINISYGINHIVGTQVLTTYLVFNIYKIYNCRCNSLELKIQAHRNVFID